MTQKIMYLNDLAKYIGKSVRTAQRWVAKGLLPPPNKTEGRSGFWIESEVEKCLNGDYKKKCDRLLKNGVDIDIKEFLRGTREVEIGGTHFIVNHPKYKWGESK